MDNRPSKYAINMTIPMGPTGPAGVADTIEIGTTSVTDDPSLASVIDNKEGNNHILSFVLPQGPKGDPGPLKISTSYLVTFHQVDFPVSGYEVTSQSRIPIKREELDIDNLCEVDTSADTIKFNKVGYYKITCTVNANLQNVSQPFDPTKDFISIGFRLVGTDNVYIGASEFVGDNLAKELVAQGIIAVENASNIYELVNLTKNSIFLNTPMVENLSTKSYFANSLVTIVVEYLGRP